MLQTSTLGPVVCRADARRRPGTRRDPSHRRASRGLRRPAPRLGRRADRPGLRPSRRPARRSAGRVDTRPRSSRRSGDGESRPGRHRRQGPGALPARGRAGPAGRRRAAAGEREVPRRGRGGGRQPQLRGAAGGRAGSAAPATWSWCPTPSMWAPDVPSICVGMRGLVAFDVVSPHGARRPPLRPVRRRRAQPRPPDRPPGGRPARRGRPGDPPRLLRRRAPADAAERGVAAPSPVSTRRPGRTTAGVRRLEGEAGRSTAGADLDPPHLRRGRHRRGLRRRRDQDDRARHRPGSR